MVHLNEIHEKYADKGLVVIAVSHQGSSPIEQFVKDQGVKYPTVSEKSDSMQAYGRSSVPSGFLIGADGRVVWSGHPGELADSKIDDLLANTKLLPPWPKELDAVKTIFEKEKYGEALSKLDKEIESGKFEGDLLDTARKVKEWIAWYGDSQLEGAAKQARGGKVYEAVCSYDFLAEAYKHLEVGTKAAEAKKALLADRNNALEFKAGEKLAKILEQIKGEKPKKALLRLRPLLGKKYADTAAGKRAAELAEKLEKEQ